MTKATKKTLYLVNTDLRNIDARHKELCSTCAHLLKNDDKTSYRYEDTINTYIDEQNGLFLILSNDRAFYQNFQHSFLKQLDIKEDNFHLLPHPKQALRALQAYRSHKKPPILFVETAYEAQSTIPFIDAAKKDFPDLLIILLMNDAEEKQLAQFLEAGVDNFITKPVCMRSLVEKIANTLEPKDVVGHKVYEGRELLRDKEFLKAYDAAREILEIKPGSPAGLMIMGDALKGLEKREDALKLYRKAVQNASQYLEPLKKLVEFHQEDGNQEEVLKNLIKIDDLSPIHVGRKEVIGDLHFATGNYEEAARYYYQAVSLANDQQDLSCVRLAESFAQKLFDVQPDLATDLLRLCSKLACEYKINLHWSLYDRLGTLLTKSKRWMEAVEAYSQASALSPDDTSLLIHTGMAYMEGKDFGSAAQKFEKALSIDPECYHGDLSTAYSMGEAFIHAHRPADATRVLAYVHEEDPKFKKVRSLLKVLDSDKIA